jgi:lipoprotein-anchoring transpeptidase ErfK/SrfK
MLEIVAALLIDLSEQKLYAYDDQQRLLYAALVSTGRPLTPTPTGRFQIGSKYRETTLVGPDYRIPAVPHVMCLSGGGLAPDHLCLHPAPWQERAGQCFGVARSHGCIRTTSATARWLFPRTALGTPVEIRP